ncbi:MAG TPA: DUF2911 domain-containing protein [Longimicrobiales bacterium]|nr:DUF2911 domain-containing protein [Longimicrobiales bacterium]
MMTRLSLPFVAVALLAPAALSAQDLSGCWIRNATPEEAMARTSPYAAVEIPLGSETAQLCYSRPSARDREVVGNLIPLGEPWRMGANETSQLILPAGGEVGGLSVDPGTYSIYVIAAEDEWEFVLNSNHQRWGIPINAEVRAADVGSVTRPVQATDDFVETFTVTFQPHGTGMGHLVMEWADTRVELPIHAAGMGH